MISAKRNRKGDLILDINLNLFTLLLKIFSSLDVIFTSKIFYTIPMGLGIGFGVGIVIFSNPKTTIATTPRFKVNENTIIPQRITLSKQNFTSIIKQQSSYTLIPLKWTANIVSFTTFPGKKNKQIIIGAKNNLIENVNLGEKIKIKATNQGVYFYSIFQIREIASKDINSLINNNGAKLIIINPANIIGSNYLVALAK